MPFVFRPHVGTPIVVRDYADNAFVLRAHVGTPIVIVFRRFARTWPSSSRARPDARESADLAIKLSARTPGWLRGGGLQAMPDGAQGT
jgi:hypothetical protein